MKFNQLNILYVIIGFSIAYFAVNAVGEDFQWEMLIFLLIGAVTAEIFGRRRLKKSGTSEFDERTDYLIKKYLNYVFISATIILLIYLIVFKYRGIAEVPINHLFLYLLVLLFALSAAAVIAKRR